MLEAIADLRSLLDGKTLVHLRKDKHLRRALERYIEIISEASRGIPKDWKDAFGPDIEWRQVQDVGNVLRHGYDKVRDDVLWNIYEFDLDPLQLALERMIAAYGSLA